MVVRAEYKVEVGSVAAVAAAAAIVLDLVLDAG